MAVLVKNKKGLNEFIAEQEVVDFTTHDIHPLFAYLQKSLDEQTKTMISARKHGLDLIVPKEVVPEDMKNMTIKPWQHRGKYGQHRPYTNSFIPGHVDHIGFSNMTSKKFYMNYLAKNKPVYIQKGCEHWDGMEKWKNGTYLRGHAMLTQSYNAMYDKNMS